MTPRRTVSSLTSLKANENTMTNNNDTTHIHDSTGGHLDHHKPPRARFLDVPELPSNFPDVLLPDARLAGVYVSDETFSMDAIWVNENGEVAIDRFGFDCVAGLTDAQFDSLHDVAWVAAGTWRADFIGVRLVSLQHPSRTRFSPWTDFGSEEFDLHLIHPPEWLRVRRPENDPAPREA